MSSYVFSDYVEILGINFLDAIGDITEKVQIKANRISHIFTVHMSGAFIFLNWSQ